MGSEHSGCVRLHGIGVTTTPFKRINGTSKQTLNATNDVMQKMQERMQKMKDKIEEQNRTIRHEVIIDVISQLQNVGLIDPNILVVLYIPSPIESISTLAAIGRKSQNSQGECLKF
ncbi:putative V-type proton ATPase subunit E-like [Capsicum annuum]|uniref:Uncharacterized protein n=1 Tax=Capsicum annuum TaxID=4072 RepID=A0A2G2ZNY0_CAPAN|nr:putative V-type proton ATPase subunit E-like [Capsicum annuum]KAF3673017.1 putative V-type proton ATPase subunit E-like [Capsicum annuum]PHT83683.1 hypothetical protein T459_12126 [Capsicum annuum]